MIISVAVGFYSVYHKVASGKGYQHKDRNANSDEQVIELHREDLDKFRAFLRSLLMHGAIGTALGGVATMVGEPQNLLIAKVVGWDFASFFLHMAPACRNRFVRFWRSLPITNEPNVPRPTRLRYGCRHWLR